jgi:hypothetical protein
VTAAVAETTPVAWDSVGGLAIASDGTVFAAVPKHDPGIPNFLTTIDPETGAGTEVGAIGWPVTALAFSPDGTLFGVADTSGHLVTPQALITISTASGASTIVGEPSAILPGQELSDVEALSFAPNGSLFGVRMDSGQLLRINTTDGAGEEIGQTGNSGADGGDPWGFPCISALAFRIYPFWPMSGSSEPDFPLSSTFGPRLKASENYRYDWHRGIDIPALCGTPVRAIADGYVRMAGDYGSYEDRMVQIRHARLEGGYYYSNYLHLSAVAVSETDSVRAGDVIGYSGETGVGQGNAAQLFCARDLPGEQQGGFDHLHFEIRYGGLYQANTIHPLHFLPYPDTTPPDVDIAAIDLSDAAAAIISATVELPPGELDLNRVELSVHDQAGATVYTYTFDMDSWTFVYTPYDGGSNLHILDTALDYDGVYDGWYQRTTDGQVITLTSPVSSGLDVDPAKFSARSERYTIGFTFFDAPALTSTDAFVVEVKAADIAGQSAADYYVHTPVGVGVYVTPIDSATGEAPATLAFSQVTEPGETTLVISATGPPPPSGFLLGDSGIYLELQTTAVFVPPIEVCVNYSGLGFASGDESLRLFHLEDDWVDRTSSLDTAQTTICGVVDSLSLFTVFADDRPISSDVVVTPNPVAVHTAMTISATVADSPTGESAIASAEYRIGDGSFVPMSAADQVFDETSEEAEAAISAFPEAGVHEVCVRGTDEHGNVGEAECILLAVYDPEGGFVTGGGWIYSEAGWCQLDEVCAGVEGKANFGFVSKYKKGATVPTGETEFQFKTGNLNFHSSSYDWLVVTGSDYAMFKGSGTINGELAPDSEAYRFRIWAGDRDPDTFRIRIWWEDADAVEHAVYDNGMDQAIGGGSIVVHTK